MEKNVGSVDLSELLKAREELNRDMRTAKRILGISRSQLHSTLLSINKVYPINYDNLLFLTNRMLGENANQSIIDYEPSLIKEKLNSLKVQ